jgi:hypothetical protein
MISRSPNSKILTGVAVALLWASIAASVAQELPSGGGAIPPVRRGANGQIEVVPPDAVNGRPGAAPAAAAPKPGSPKASRDSAAPAVRNISTSRSPVGPQPVITVTPDAPRVPDTTPHGAIVATYSVRMSDNSPFNGTVQFGPPYYDNKGKFALRGNAIIVNPNGPGIGPNRATIIDHITLEAIPATRVGR